MLTFHAPSKALLAFGDCAAAVIVAIRIAVVR
jgi:hypothetical protein